MEYNIQSIRDKLHKLLEKKDINSEEVLILSQELDKLILLHYSNSKK